MEKSEGHPCRIDAEPIGIVTYAERLFRGLSRSADRVSIFIQAKEKTSVTGREPSGGLQGQGHVESRFSICKDPSL